MLTSQPSYKPETALQSAPRHEQVDGVHVRRLRAKLGNEHEALIGTVRNVGYKFVSPSESRSTDTSTPQHSTT